jgi:hypothetical protein
MQPPPSAQRSDLILLYFFFFEVFFATFLVAFAVFAFFALIVQQWSPQDGHYPPTAYQSAFALCIALQAIALIWFAMPWLLTFVKNLSDSLARREPEPDHQAGFAAIAGTVIEANRPAEW